MSEKQFKVLSGGFGEDGNPLYLIKDTTDMIGDYEMCKKVIEQQDTISTLKVENERLRQILKDIVGATDETHAKNMSMFKVTVVLDYEKYMEIRRCIK